MAGHTCPWWGGFFIDNPLRRLLHKPERILAPYVRRGMKVIDFGCGMGLFSIAMAVSTLVGRAIGQGRPDLARRRAAIGSLVNMAYMGFMALVYKILDAS